jgi:nitrite reductase (NO-forming)
MKKILFVLMIIGLISCTEDSSTAELEEESTSYPAGKKIYDRSCITCHQENGEGLPGSFPPLAKADYMLDDRDRAIKQVINGSSGEIIVNGETYNGIMPAQNLRDQEVVDVMNYVFNSWGNDAGEVTMKQVKSARHSK